MSVGARTGIAWARSGFLLVVPPIAITAAAWSLLPAPYQAFDRGVPVWLVLFESTLRGGVMGLAAFSIVRRHGEVRAGGWWLYGLGLHFYLASYLLQVFMPESGWSRSAVGFAAPAWTTAFWLLGIGLVARPWSAFPWIRVAYPLAAAAFVVVHTTHALLAFAAW